MKLSLFRKQTLLIAGIIWIARYAPAAESIAITEFMSEPLGADARSEWIELYNYGSKPVNLSRWIISDSGSDRAKVPAATIAPRDYLILASSKRNFENQWFAGISSSRVVEYSGRFTLSAFKDEIILKNAAGNLVWQLAYGDDESPGQATFLTGQPDPQDTDKTDTVPVIRRTDEDTAGVSGYDSNYHTTDSLAFRSAYGDLGSPLAGEYNPANSAKPLHVIDASPRRGKRFNPGVRGIAIADDTIDRTSYQKAIPDSLTVCDGSALRGVAGGLYADLYDWKVRNNGPRPPTLQFLRWARDHKAEFYITANMRGLVVPDGPGRTRYYTTDTATLAALAGDWVRYTNHIVTKYRQGGAITNNRDKAILDSLVWKSAFPGDNFDTLPAPGEAPIPKVTYWELGNEPTVTTSNSIGVNNGIRLEPPEYYTRYKAITAAMKAEDRTIKVGPCVVGAASNREQGHLNTILADPKVPVDFISYHPYQRMGDEDLIPDIETQLGGVYNVQFDFAQKVRDLVTSNGRALDSVELVASEVCVSYWSYNDTPKEGEMAHCLGSVESVFAHARLGLSAAHYWIWPAHAGDGTWYPLTMAYAKLRDHMGDTLLDAHSVDNALRIYTTRDSTSGTVAIWGLNLSNTQDRTEHIALKGIRGAKVRLLRLQNVNGPTTLLSSNLSPQQAGGPKSDVKWTEAEIPDADLSDLSVTFKAAELTLLLIEPEKPKTTRPR